MRSLLIAIRCLTIVPMPGGDADDDRAVARSRFWYPLVGVAIGLVLGAAAAAARRIFGESLLGAALIVFVWVTLTGALHLDGLADCCDGLFARGDRARRLEIMRDPHVGTFGVVAIVLCLLIKTAAINALESPQLLASAMLVAGVSGRAAILIVAGLSPYARVAGTGKPVIDAAGWRDCLWAGLWLVALAGATHWTNALAALALVFASGAIWVYLCRWRIGGVTGDCLGAACEITETLVLLCARFATVNDAWPQPA